MAFCTKCGAELRDAENFCPACGEKVNPQKSDVPPEVDLGAKFQEFNDTVDTTYEYDKQDISDNKGLTVLSYIGWLVLIPLFVRKNSPFAQFHAKQGFTLAVFETAYAIASKIVYWTLSLVLPTALDGLLGTVLDLGSIAFLVLMIIGIVNVAHGKAKELPIIGRIRIIK